MANIDKELRDIKNAVYGREVRGSIHDGIDKINKESEESKAKADEAHAVMESIMTEGFDNAALESNFEQNLDDKIANLQPEWTQFKEDTTARLTQTIDYTTNITNVTDGGGHKKPYFTFIADDAPKNDLDLFVPIMNEKNIPFGIGVVTDWVGKTLNLFDTQVEFMDWKDLKYIETVGGQILGHSHTHPDLTSVTKEQMIQEIKDCKKILSEKGFVADGFIYPHNRYDTDVIRNMKRNFTYSFTGSGDNQPIVRNAHIRRTAFGSFGDPPREGYPQDTLSYEYYKARVDHAFDNNDWLVFTIHTANPSFMDSTQRQYLRDIIDYIRSRGGEILSPRDAFRRFGNVLETGNNNYIASDGDNSFNKLKIDRLNGKGADSHINETERGAITITPITKKHAENEGFPGGAAGILSTYHFADSTTALNYRKYESLLVDGGTNYVSELNIQFFEGGKWTDWIIQRPYPYKKKLNIKTSSTIDVSKGNLIVFDILGDETEVDSIVGGAEGQEIIIMSILNTGITIKHIEGTSDSGINLKGKEDRLLRKFETIRLLKVSKFWVEV